MRDAQTAQPAATRCAQVAALPGLACLCASVGVVSGPCVQRDAPIVWLPGLGRSFASWPFAALRGSESSDGFGRDWCLEIFMPFAILGAFFTLLAGAATLLVQRCGVAPFQPDEKKKKK